MRRLKITTVLLLLMFAACDSPESNEPANANGRPANTNAAAAQPAQDNNSALAQPISPAPNNQPIQPVPLAKSNPAGADANSKTAPPRPTGPAPKFVVPDKELDFGKQPQEKTLTRTIAIKNEGKRELQIESVQPG